MEPLPVTYSSPELGVLNLTYPLARLIAASKRQLTLLQTLAANPVIPPGLRNTIRVALIKLPGASETLSDASLIEACENVVQANMNAEYGASNEKISYDRPRAITIRSS